jgi:hypothetical protein
MILCNLIKPFAVLLQQYYYMKALLETNFIYKCGVIHEDFFSMYPLRVKQRNIIFWLGFSQSILQSLHVN